MISNPDKNFSQEMITFLEEPDCCSIENKKKPFYRISLDCESLQRLCIDESSQENK